MTAAAIAHRLSIAAALQDDSWKAVVLAVEFGGLAVGAASAAAATDVATGILFDRIVERGGVVVEGWGKRLVVKPVAVPLVAANQLLKLPTFDNDEPMGPHDGALLGLLTGDHDPLPTMNAVCQGIVSGDHVFVPFLLALSQLHEFQRQHRGPQATAHASAAHWADAALPDLKTFASAQLDLARAQIADNLRRKDARDRPVTERLRLIERRYADVLRRLG